jgi:hypothetical protein
MAADLAAFLEAARLSLPCPDGTWVEDVSVDAARESGGVFFGR